MSFCTLTFGSEMYKNQAQALMFEVLRKSLVLFLTEIGMNQRFSWKGEHMENILIGLNNVYRPEALIILICGVFGGIMIGALPGLTSTMGVALMLPITYGMDASTGIVML
ncbi:MAG: tripartite tricarboxylate transporter permease, partial [Bacillota bacterium]